MTDSPEVSDTPGEHRLEKDVANQIKVTRKQRGFTQECLAIRADMQQPAIARIESGSDNMTLETLKRVAEALGCTVAVTIFPRLKEHL